MKTNNYLNSLFKKIIYCVVMFLITLYLLLFSIQNEERMQEIQLKTFSLLSPFIKITHLSLSPFLIVQDSNLHNCEHTSINNVFSKVLTEKLENLQLSIKSLNQVTKTLKLNIIFITPTYYSSSGILTDVIFANATLGEVNIVSNLAVISSDGLFGRVSSINKDTISIVPILNELSRIPVYTKQSNIYGVALGDGFGMTFEYPNNQINDIVDGELVLTSGENNLLISEIPVGLIKKENGIIKIIPFSTKRASVLGLII